MYNLPQIKQRIKDTHKGDYGHLVTVGGSAAFAGALYLTSYAGIRIGAGLVTAVHPARISPMLYRTPEIMGFPVGADFFTEADVDNVCEFINRRATCMSIGSGAGQRQETQNFIKQVLAKTECPVLIDADGINALSLKDLSDIKKRDVILTPHLGEFAKLTNISIPEIKTDQELLARQFSLNYNLTLVLKSAKTVIADNEGNTTISEYGSPALAKGGSGDCLAGIIVGLMAQGYSIADSAKLGCFILGRSCELALEDPSIHEMTLLATDVINNFGKTLNEL